MLAQFTFSETSPAAASTTAVSSQAVSSAASWAAPGVAAPLDDAVVVDVLATLQGATGGTLDIYVQVSGDDGIWRDAIHFAQLAAGAASITYQASLTSRAQATVDTP